MLLSGLRYPSFILEPTVETRAGAMLRPRYEFDRHQRIAYGMGTTDPARYWTESEVVAAARWWRGLAEGREPADLRHVWFGGGVAFGRVTPGRGADMAVDVLVLSAPSAERPSIAYEDGHVEVDCKSGDLTYITVDTTREQVRAAADWWASLR